MQNPLPLLLQKKRLVHLVTSKLIYLGGVSSLLGLLVITIAVDWLRRERLQPPIYEGIALEGMAADFSLIDQQGATLSLSNLQGQVVVLTFLDSQCQEICPLTAAHLRMAHQALGAATHAVTFIGINVNTAAAAVTDVAAATRKWQLDEIPSWHFLTGRRENLEPVWQAYDIGVASAEGELLHTPGVYVMDGTGHKRWYVSTAHTEAYDIQEIPPLNELLVKHVQALLQQR
jgi:protein SCO1